MLGITHLLYDGFPIVSYYAASTGDLKVAHCITMDCSFATTTTFDSTSAQVGFMNSIAIGSDGLPIVSYYDLTNGYLKVAHCTSMDCSSALLTTVDSSASVGTYTSIAIGSDDLPIVSYYDTTNTSLKVAHCTTLNCSSVTLSTVDSDPQVGQYTSIAIASDGYPIMSYYSFLNNELIMAHYLTLNCSSSIISILDSNGNVGQYGSITIGSNDIPIISYFDSSNQDLKVFSLSFGCPETPGLYCPQCNDPTTIVDSGSCIPCTSGHYKSDWKLVHNAPPVKPASHHPQTSLTVLTVQPDISSNHLIATNAPMATPLAILVLPPLLIVSSALLALPRRHILHNHWRNVSFLYPMPHRPIQQHSRQHPVY